MRKSRWMRPVSMVLSLAMAFSLAVTAPQKVAEAAEGDTAAPSTEAEVLAELQTVLNNNKVVFGEITDENQFTARKYVITSPDNRLIGYAQEESASKYKLIDVNGDGQNEILMVKGKTFTPMIENPDMSTTSKGAAAKNFKEAKKVGKTIIVKSVKGKTTTYTTYTFTSDKYKKSTVYTVKGKTYKKGSKKIKKKAFNKFLKKYKKSKALKFESIPSYPIEAYDFSDFMYVTKNFMVKDLFTEDGEVNVVARYDAEDKGNEYKGFVETNVYDGKHGTTRTIFGPKVKNPKTGKTYEEDDFSSFVTYTMDVAQYLGFASITNIDLSGDVEVSFAKKDGDPAIYDEKTAATANTVVYTVSYGDTAYELIVFSDGPFAGKICGLVESASVGAIIGYYNFFYGADAEAHVPDGELYTPALDAECYGEIGETRKVEIGGDYPYTVTTGKNITLVLGGPEMSGKYTAVFSDDTTLTYDPDDIENQLKFDTALNPGDGDSAYADADFKELKWAPKA